MNKTPLLIAGIVFAIVAIVHVLRLFYHWDITIAGQVIPMSASIVGLIVAGLLALWMFVAAGRE